MQKLKNKIQIYCFFIYSDIRHIANMLFFMGFVSLGYWVS